MQIWVDNKLYVVDIKTTIFQFCAKIGINLPCFCYHEKLTIAGNCRMCLVEVSTAANLVVSCAMPILDKMQIFTFTKRVRKAREHVLEFLLLNHPLDCPICDQGGECDLQDLSMVIGTDRSRFYESFKRAVDNLHCLGPLVKTVMTRCIHCTRCVRFLNEVSGVPALGVIGRGQSMEIGTYISNFITDELLGNIIDLCPVGALTSMPYAFNARSWELKKFKSIDILDALGSSIRVDVVNNSVIRIVPYIDEFVNEEWITNKARFSYDSLLIQRSNSPQICIYGKSVNLSWHTALIIFLRVLYKYRFNFISIICGAYLNLEAAISLKYFFISCGCSNFVYNEEYMFNFDFRFAFLLNNTLVQLETIVQVLFIGTNVRLEAPLVNQRLRKAYLSNYEFRAFSIGLALNHLTYPTLNLSNTIESLAYFLMGKFPMTKMFFIRDYYNLIYFNTLKCNLNVFVGSSFLRRSDSADLFLTLLKTSELLDLSFSSFNILSSHLGRISYAEFGVIPSASQFSNVEHSSFFYLCGVDVESLSSRISSFLSSNFSTFQGSFLSSKISFNLILPVSVYTEGVFSFINLEGRYRKTAIVIVPHAGILSDWEILETMSIIRKYFLIWNFSVVKDFYRFAGFFKSLIDYSCSFFHNFSQLYLKIRREISISTCNRSYFMNNSVSIAISRLFCSKLNKTIYNYYMSDVFSINSRTMMLCARKTKMSLFRETININS